MGEAESLQASQRQHALPDASLRKSEQDKEKSMVVAVVHLAVYAWKRTNVHPTFQKSVVASIKTIRRFLSSSTVPIDSLFFQVPLAAMPFLLCHSDNLTVVKSLALLGDMVMHSFKSMLQTVRERRVLWSLLGHLNSTNIEIQREACLTTACIASSRQGQKGLCELGVVQKLMRLLLSVTGFLKNNVDQKAVKNSLEVPSKSYFSSHSDILILSAVLEALDSLIGNSNFDSLQPISQRSRMPILKALQIIWKRFRNSCQPPLHSNHIHVVAKMIVWISMEHEDFNNGLCVGATNADKVLFGGGEFEITHFWDVHWEKSPFLMAENVNGGHTRHKFLKCWHFEGDSIFLRKLFTESVACPAFNCDELESSQIYREIENDLGNSMQFGQDIRLVKSFCTAGCSMPCSTHTNLEKDYHNDDLTRMEFHGNPNSIDIDINTCLTAYELGFTIALRGLEFRCSYIAEIAEKLAIFFGQATVGANLYMTPINAQGFKPHYDDHCVFVWQLSGWKSWNLLAPEMFLPRLYSQDTTLKRVCRDEESNCKLLLSEGNILYIPRGFLHSATTQVNADMSGQLYCVCLKCVQKGGSICSESRLCNDNLASLISTNNEGCLNKKKRTVSSLDPFISGNFNSSKKSEYSAHNVPLKTGHSLHITFGVEVEPPFDWEGFVHISLCCWASKQEWSVFNKSNLGEGACDSSATKSGNLYEGLMHVAIRLCGERCSTFRKACLIAAKPQQFEASATTRFESLFKELMREVTNSANFTEALNVVLTAMETSECTSLDWMRWLRHLSAKHKPSVWNDPVVFFHERLLDKKTCNGSLKQMEAKFNAMKECFISSASYADACDAFVGLLNEYRRVRKKYTMGMLALHG